MADQPPDTALPQPNVYGWLVGVSFLAGLGALTLGGSPLAGVGLLALALVVLGIAMARGTDEEDGPESVDNEDGTHRTEQKANAEVGGATGCGGE